MMQTEQQSANATSPETIRRIVGDWLDANGYVEDLRWYTREEWAAKGGTMCREAPWHIVMEGSLLQPLLDFAWANWEGTDERQQALYDEFCDLLDANGWCHAVGYRWSAHLFPERA